MMRRSGLVRGFIAATLPVCVASAFEVNKTSGGLPIKWAEPSMSYVINANSGPSGTATAIVNAMGAWNAVPKSEFRFSHAGSTTIQGASRDGSNVCSFDLLEEDGTLAINSWWYTISTGEILESDITFNTAHSWSASGAAGKYDLQSVATHELGHSLSLKDLYSSSDAEKTMYGRTSAGETKQRTLEADDKAGIVYLYPSSASSFNLTPYKPSGWGDKIVVSTKTGTSTDSTPLYATNTLYVDWAVINSGVDAISSSFQTALYVDGVLKKTWYTDPPLYADSYTWVADYSLGSLSAGTHTITVTADSGGAVSETSESDNQVTKTVTVLAPPSESNLTPYKPSGWGDKIVVSSGAGTSSDSAFLYSTDTLYVDWAVLNAGVDAIGVSFQTALYVDGVLKNTWRTDPPLNARSYAWVADYALGSLSAGTHTLTLKADSGGAVSETSESDNQVTKTVTVLPAALPRVSATLGVAFEYDLDRIVGAAAKVTVKGLPSGVKYNALTRRLEGVPLAYGSFVAQMYASSLVLGILPIEVADLPAWAKGAFNGFYEEGGVAVMSVTAQGKIVGKIATGGLTYTFTASSYAAGGSAEEGFSFSTLAKAGRVSVPLTVNVSHVESTDFASLGYAFGTPGGGSSQIRMWRNVWAEAPSELGSKIGYYTASLPGNAEFGSGYLTFTVDKLGRFKAAGKMADGTAVSTAGTLLIDATKTVVAVVYAAPSAYKGGHLYGLAEWSETETGAVVLRTLNESWTFDWHNLNPQATGVYGAGFDRQLGLVGGKYQQADSLYAYYGAKTLTASVDSAAAAPELTVGALRYEAAKWSPDGVVLTPLSNRSGALTGFAAPAAGKPVGPDGNGGWDYGAENTVGLKLSFAPATGIYKGSFKAWFDYPPLKHLSKTLLCEGVLTPVREDLTDGVEGRGYFLWADKAVNPFTLKTYPFSWSYDFWVSGEWR